MSLVTVLWSMSASACLTLAMIHGLIWWRQRAAMANLLFALAAIGTAGFAAGELGMMHAGSTDAYGATMRWTHVAVWIITLSLAGFVRLYFRAGRAWLLWSVCGLRTLSLLANFRTGASLNFRAITRLEHISFLGQTVSVPAGVFNPWTLVGKLSLALLIVYVVDASISVWRRRWSSGASSNGRSSRARSI